MGGDALALTVIGERAYLQLGTAHFMVVDISDPYKPTQIGTSHLVAGGISSIGTDGSALMITDLGNKLHAFDVSNDLNPALIQPPASVANSGSNLLLNEASSKNYRFVYLENHYQDPLRQQILAIYPFGSLDDSEQIGTAIGPLSEDDTATSARIVARGRYVYLADNDTFRIFDIAQAPRVVDRSAEAVANDYWWPEIGNLTVDVGTTVFVGHYRGLPTFCVVGRYLKTDKGNWSLDKPESPVLRPDKAKAVPDCHSFSTSDGIIYQIHPGKIPPGGRDTPIYGFTDVLSIMNMTDADHFSTREVKLGAETGQIAGIDGSRLYYVVNDQQNIEAGALAVFDISDINNAKLLGRIDSLYAFGEFDTFKAVGRYIFWFHYIHSPTTIVLDVSNPASIRQIASPGPDVLRFEHAASDGQYVFVGTGAAIEVYRADDFDHVITTLSLPSPALSTWQEGVDDVRLFGKLLTTVRTNGSDQARMDFIDVSDPTNPRLMAETDQYPFQLAAYQDIFYINNLSNGIGIYRLVSN